MPGIPKDSWAGVFLLLKVQVGLMDESTPTAPFTTKPQRIFHTWEAFRRLPEPTPPGKAGPVWRQDDILGQRHRGWELQSKSVREPLIRNPTRLLRGSPEKHFNQCKGSHWLPWELGQTSVQWDCLPQSNHGIIQLSFCWQHSRRQIVFSPVLVSIQNNSIHVTTAIPYLFLCN